MGLNLTHLDQETRKLMLKEVESDIERGELYISRRLNERGRVDYPLLLKEATLKYDDTWLADSLRSKGLLKSSEQKRKPKGGYTVTKVPVNAPERLAEGEFNRFYIRAVCLRAIKEGLPKVEIYKAKSTHDTRQEAEALIGTKVSAEILLENIKASLSLNEALGLPPNSSQYLSVRLP